MVQLRSRAALALAFSLLAQGIMAQGVMAQGVMAQGVMADVMPLAAHRAVYDLKLTRSSGGKALTDARTVIAVEFSGTECDGYISSFRQMMDLTPAEGPV